MASVLLGLLIASVAMSTATMVLDSMKPRAMVPGELALTRMGQPWFKRMPRTPGTVASLVNAVWATDPRADVVRVRWPGRIWKGAPVELDVVVPWPRVAPWRRRSLERDLQGTLDLIVPTGQSVKVKVTWR